MKIQIASDLHLEFLEKRFPDSLIVEPADADLLVIAGDIHRQAQAVEAFRNWPVPVVYVHGNHEPYGAHYHETVDQLRAASAGTRVRYLEHEEYMQDSVRFLGCCLWTDYLLLAGGDEQGKQAAMKEAEICLNDHRLIEVDGGVFSPADAERLHAESRRWLQMKLDEDFPGKTVVVTHHAPHVGSVHPRFADSILNAAFASDLSALLGKADLWIHGHVHDSFDYDIDGTRVIANPRGYALNLNSAESLDNLEWENPQFDPRLVVTIQS